MIGAKARQPERFRLDPALGERLSCHRILRRRAIAGGRLPREVEKTPGEVMQAYVWFPRPVRSCMRTVMPTFQPPWRGSEEMIAGHPDVVEEDFVELGVARQLHQGPDRDARAPHVHQEARDALVLRRRRVRPGRGGCTNGSGGRSRSTPSGPTRGRRHRPGPRASARDARSEPRPRLGGALAPDVLRREDRGRKRRRCASVPPLHDPGPRQHQADGVHAWRRAPARTISSWKIICSTRLAPRPPYASAGPRDADPPAPVEPLVAMSRHAELGRMERARTRRRRQARSAR